MLGNKTWNALASATSYLKKYIGKSFFNKEWNCYVTIYNYTLSTQLLYKSKDNRYGAIWEEEYLKLC